MSNNKLILIATVIIFSLTISLVCLFVGYNNREKEKGVEISKNGYIKKNTTNDKSQINDEQKILENEILVPVISEIDDLKNKESFIIKGATASNVQMVWVSIYSENCTSYSMDVPNFKQENNEWKLKASNDKNDNDSALICFGRNEYTIHFSEIKNGRSSDEKTDKKIAFISDVGYDEVAHSDTAQRIKKFINNKGISVADDNSIITIFDLNEACEKMNLTGRENLEENIDFIPLAQIANSNNLYAKVRSSVKNKDKNLIGIGGWGNDLLEYSGTHILEFYEKENENYVVKKTLPAINGWECEFPGEFKIYYFNPTMIIVAVSGGHEASPVNLYFDGEKWNSLNDLIIKELNYSIDKPAIYLAPMNIVANKDYFSMTEYRYCCDVTFWLYPNKKTELIFDVNTKIIVDVKLHKQTTMNLE